MMTTTTTTAETIAPKDRYAAAFGEFSAGLPAEPERLRRLRHAAIERFADLGFPHVKMEEWRFTNGGPRAPGTGEGGGGEKGRAPWGPGVLKKKKEKLTTIDVDIESDKGERSEYR